VKSLEFMQMPSKILDKQLSDHQKEAKKDSKKDKNQMNAEDDVVSIKSGMSNMT